MHVLCDDTGADISVAVFEISQGMNVKFPFVKIAKIHHAVILVSLVTLSVRFTLLVAFNIATRLVC